MSVWTDLDRSTRIRVLAGNLLSDITRSVTGDITVTRQAGNPVVTCSIPVASPYLPLFVSGSWSKVPFPVEIWVECWSNESTSAIARIFKGQTEIPENSGSVLPLGTLRAVSDSADWANRSGCLVVQGFNGSSRLTLLQDFASNGGFTLSILGSPSTGMVNKPVDLQSVSLMELLNRWGLVDGWIPRESSGQLELVPMSSIAGPSASSVYSFNPGNYFTIQEKPPNRPVTRYMVTGTNVYVAGDETNTITSGDYSNAQTTVDGALDNEVSETSGDYTPIGIGTGSPVTGVITRTTTTYTWNTNGSGEPNGRPATKEVKVEGYYCPYSYMTGDAFNVTFTDGSFRYLAVGWPSDHEEFVEISKELTTYTWDASFCFLKERTVEKWGWQKRPKYPSDGGTTYTWPDGKEYLDAYETYDQVSAYVEKYSYYQPDLGVEAHVAGGFRGGFNQREVIQNTITVTKEARIYGSEINEYFKKWSVENADKTATQIFHEDHSDGIPIWTGTLYAGFQGQGKNEFWQEEGNGPLTLPPKRSAAQRVFSTTKFRLEYTLPSDYPEVVEAIEIQDAESVEEAQRAVAWKARNDFSDVVVISAPLEPSVVELACIDVTDPVRAMSAEKGWVKEVTYSLNPANGKAYMAVTTAIDLMSTTAP